MCIRITSFTFAVYTEWKEENEGKLPNWIWSSVTMTVNEYTFDDRTKKKKRKKRKEKK